MIVRKRCWKNWKKNFLVINFKQVFVSVLFGLIIVFQYVSVLFALIVFEYVNVLFALIVVFEYVSVVFALIISNPSVVSHPIRILIW